MRLEYELQKTTDGAILCSEILSTKLDYSSYSPIPFKFDN
jgi:hypothetical protein